MKETLKRAIDIEERWIRAAKRSLYRTGPVVPADLGEWRIATKRGALRMLAPWLLVISTLVWGWRITRPAFDLEQQRATARRAALDASTRVGQIEREAKQAAADLAALKHPLAPQPQPTKQTRATRARLKIEQGEHQRVVIWYLLGLAGCVAGEADVTQRARAGLTREVDIDRALGFRDAVHPGERAATLLDRDCKAAPR